MSRLTLLKFVFYHMCMSLLGKEKKILTYGYFSKTSKVLQRLKDYFPKGASPLNFTYTSIIPFIILLQLFISIAAL